MLMESTENQHFGRFDGAVFIPERHETNGFHSMGYLTGTPQLTQQQLLSSTTWPVCDYPVVSWVPHSERAIIAPVSKCELF